MKAKDIINNEYGVARHGYKFMIKVYEYNGDVHYYIADSYAYCKCTNSINYTNSIPYGLHPKVIRGKIFLDKIECYEIIEKLG